MAAEEELNCNFQSMDNKLFQEHVQIKEEIIHEIPVEVKIETTENFEQEQHSCFDLKEEDPLSAFERSVKVETPTRVPNQRVKIAFSCTFESCTKSFPLKGHLIEHMRVHTGEKPFMCTQDNCKKNFKTKSALVAHVKSHTNEKTYICSDCGKAFNYCSSLNNHKRIHLGKYAYRCEVPECNQIFKKKIDLINHNIDIHKLERFSCSYESCPRSFPNRWHLEAHIRVHTGEKPFTCDYENCGKSFKTTSALNTHVKGHTDEKPYVCVDCGRAFNYASSLSHHQKLHSDEKPFICESPGCKQSFKRKTELNAHMNYHKQVKFSCTFENCDKVYNSSNGLKFHMRSHNGEKPFKCPQEDCPKAFWFKYDYSEHIRIHSGEKPFACDHPNCGKRFTCKRQLKLHKTEHENRLFVCTFSDPNRTVLNGEASEVCAKLFKNQRTLNEHIRRHKAVKRVK